MAELREVRDARIVRGSDVEQDPWVSNELLARAGTGTAALLEDHKDANAAELRGCGILRTGNLGIANWKLGTRAGEQELSGPNCDMQQDF